MILPSAGLLAATKSHKSRHWAYLPTLPSEDSSEGPSPLGTLHLVQSRGVKSYTLAIVRESNGRPMIVFTRKAQSADTHRVTLADTRKAGACSCAGHHFAHHCAHVDAVLSMLAAGVLPDPAEWLAERERAAVLATLAEATKSLTAAGLTVGPPVPINV